MAYTSKRYAPLFSPTHTTCSPHPSGLQPPCRVGFVRHTDGHSIQVDKCSRPQSGHSDLHSDRVPGCTSPLGSAKETFKVRAGTLETIWAYPFMMPHRYPPRFWTLPPRTSDTTYLTLTSSEALPAGAFKSWVGGVAHAPIQTGPGEAGVSLILAVCACVARATQTAEGVHAIHTGSSIEAGTGK